MTKVSAALLNSPQYGGFRAYVDAHVVKDLQVHTPARFLWAGYNTYCKKYGFPICTTKEFRAFLVAEPGLTMKVIDNDPERVIRAIVHGGYHHVPCTSPAA